MIELFHFPARGEPARALPLEEVERVLAERHGFVWVDLEKPSPSERTLLTEVFRFHPLALEDCEAPRHHPKVEEYGDTLFLIIHGLLPESTHREFRTRPLAIFLGPGYLVTYRRERLPALDELKAHVRNHPEHPPEGPDFLMYRILDGLVDMYLPVLDLFDAHIAQIEQAIFRRPEPRLLDEIFAMRRAVMRLRRISAHQREILTRLYRMEFRQIDERCATYMRNVYDHLVRSSDLAEAYRDLLGGALDAYLSAVANRTNQIMKVLTVFTAIFIPLTFLAGVYGMNFRYMPELEWRWGYPAVWGVMLAVALITVALFRRRGYF
jgi:magnesium transporter